MRVVFGRYLWLLIDTEQTQAQLLQAAQNLLKTGMEIGQVIELLDLSGEQVNALQLPN